MNEQYFSTNQDTEFLEGLDDLGIELPPAAPLLADTPPPNYGIPYESIDIDSAATGHAHLKDIRAKVGEKIAALVPTSVAEDVDLVVSEFGGNAEKNGGITGVAVGVSGSEITVSITNPATHIQPDTLPTAAAMPGAAAEGGRGFPIAQAVSRQVGHVIEDNQLAVWFAVPRSARAA